MNKSQSSAYFIALDHTTWVAYRNLANSICHTSKNDSHKINQPIKKSHTSYRQNRQDVRELLSELLSFLEINDTLNDDSFPYRLTQNAYFVCFSHSPQSCAVILSQTHSVGIDVETQQVPHKIAQRHFAKQELAYLKKQSIPEQSQLIRRLWQVKECLIKIDKQTLFTGLKTDFSFLLPELHNSILNDDLDNQQFQMVLNQKISDNSPLSKLWIDNKRNFVALY